jgi:hypothetical protein
MCLQPGQAGVNQPGSWNSEHNHGAQPLAGAYYIYDGFSDGADKSAIANRMAGVRLSNPRVDDLLATTPMSELAPNGPHGWPMPDKTLLDPDQASSIMAHHWTDEALGSSGSLALWHGRIRHWVPPHQGDLSRVMIGTSATSARSSVLDLVFLLLGWLTKLRCAFCCCTSFQHWSYIRVTRCR